MWGLLRLIPTSTTSMVYKQCTDHNCMNEANPLPVNRWHSESCIYCLRNIMWYAVPVLKRLCWRPCFLLEWLHLRIVEVFRALCPPLLQIIFMGPPLHNQPLWLCPAPPGQVVWSQCWQGHHSNTARPPAYKYTQSQCGFIMRTAVADKIDAN